MQFDKLKLYQPFALAALRIVTALLFLEHGTMKLLHFPAAAMDGPLPPLMLAAGLLETVGGVLLVLGVFTRAVAFVLSGQMAVAYFMAHLPTSFYPSINEGEAAIMFCFMFLYLVFAGPGALALDSRLKVSK